MAVRDFALPDLGEGLTESELVRWHVAVGDTVELNQTIAEVETAKALVELPSPFAGKIAKLYHDEGTTVQVGAPLLAFDLSGADGGVEDVGPAEDVPTEGAPEPVDAEEPADAVDSSAGDATPAREPVLVGYGPRAASGARPQRKRRGGAPSRSAAVATATGIATAAASATDAAGVQTSASSASPTSAPSSPSPASPTSPTEADTDQGVGMRPRSTPPVRKLARDRGIDLTTITGTGPRGLITHDDVEKAATTGGAATISVGTGANAADAGGARSGERETRTPIKGVRKHTAAAMVSSAFTAPHASEFLTIDVTESLTLIESLRTSSAFSGVRLNLLALVAKAVCLAVDRTPAVNARWDEDAQEIVQYHYINLGIAAATPRGLMVPNIKDAHAMHLAELAQALGELVAKAKEGASSPTELSGGTLSITNIGVFGIDAGTPILPPGEALILALGAVRRLPWEHHGEIALRDVLTLSISFDHRLVDGEQASLFLADVGRILSKPAHLLAMV